MIHWKYGDSVSECIDHNYHCVRKMLDQTEMPKEYKIAILDLFKELASYWCEFYAIAHVLKKRMIHGLSTQEYRRITQGLYNVDGEVMRTIIREWPDLDEEDDE